MQSLRAMQYVPAMSRLSGGAKCPVKLLASPPRSPQAGAAAQPPPLSPQAGAAAGGCCHRGRGAAGGCCHRGDEYDLLKNDLVERMQWMKMADPAWRQQMLEKVESRRQRRRVDADEIIKVFAKPCCKKNCCAAFSKNAPFYLRSYYNTMTTKEQGQWMLDQVWFTRGDPGQWNDQNLDKDEAARNRLNVAFFKIGNMAVCE